MTVGVILAGGRATRMGGGDKGLLPLQGKPLLSQVIERLKPQVEQIVINANGEPDRLKAFMLPVVADSIEGFAGPLAGVLAGMDWAAARGARSIVTVAADTPFFPLDLVKRLKNAGPLSLAATPMPNTKTGFHPTFGLWPVALRDDLRKSLEAGTRKVLVWTDRHSATTAFWQDESAFFNVNTPDDLARAETMF